MDNPFLLPTDGEADWDSSLNVNFNVLERGYHFTERAGVAINSGAVVWLNSGGFAFPFDPNSVSIFPHGLSYSAVGSGDSATFLAWGIVRSLGINSVSIPGAGLYVSALTPGLIVTTPTGHKIGRGLTGYGVLFNPSIGPQRLGHMLDVNTNGIGDGSILKWANASSKWIIAVDSTGGGGGGTTLAALTDVNTNGIGDGSILKWANASSKWIIAVDSTGGGGVSVGSPPGIVQVGFLLGGNVVTLPTTPSSGNFIVGMGWNPGSSTLESSWTKNAENTTGTDFSMLGGKALTGPGPTVNTFSVNSNAAMITVVIELHGGKGATPTFIVAANQAQQGGSSPSLPVVPNVSDMISLHGIGILSSASSLTNLYNVTSLVFANSGASRQAAVGWSWVDRALGQMLATYTQSTTYKGMVGLYKS